MAESYELGSPSPMADAALGRDLESVCNRLVDVLGDAAHGWRIAADGVSSNPLSEEMRRLAHRREEMAVEIANVIVGRSGEVEAHATAKGVVFTWWLKARAAMSHGDPDAILAVCRAGSDAAIKEFDSALETDLPDPVRDLVVRQADEIRETREWLRAQTGTS